MTTSSAAAAIIRSYCKATTVVIRHHDEDSNVMFSIISGIAQGALDRLDSSNREKWLKEYATMLMIHYLSRNAQVHALCQLQSWFSFIRKSRALLNMHVRLFQH